MEPILSEDQINVILRLAMTAVKKSGGSAKEGMDTVEAMSAYLETIASPGKNTKRDEWAKKLEDCTRSDLADVKVMLDTGVMSINEGVLG